MRAVHRKLALIAPLAAVLVASCSGDAPSTQLRESTAPSIAGSLTPSEVKLARSQLLPAMVLPQLSVESRVLTAADLVAEADDARVTRRVAATGLRGLVERAYRGRSRSITGAESRTLVFDSASGARAFNRFLAHNPGPFFGAPSTTHDLRLGSAKGYLIEPPACDCPGAYPVRVGVLAANKHIVWLQVTGPKASDARLKELLQKFDSFG